MATIQEKRHLKSLLQEIKYKLKGMGDTMFTGLDVRLLAEKTTLSERTIERLFGKEKRSFYFPSHDTLNLLAQFVEYKDWNEYLKKQKSKPKSLPLVTQNWKNKVLFCYFPSYHYGMLRNVGFRLDIYKHLKWFVPLSGVIYDNMYTTKSVKVEVMTYLLHAFTKPVCDQQYYCILGNAGAGKTTLLLNLYLKYKTKLYGNKMELLIANNLEVLEHIFALPKKRKQNTILLIDGFDEMITGPSSYLNSFEDIITCTEDFYKVVISTRTTFFDRYEDEPNLVKANTKQLFKKIYLSPFTSKQRNTYLKKRFKTNINKQQDIIKLLNQREIQDITSTPLLLYFITNLLNKGHLINPRKYGFCEQIVTRWLEREGYSPAAKNTVELRKMFECLARHLYNSKKTTFSLTTLLNNKEVGKRAIIRLHQLKSSEKRFFLQRDNQNNYKFAHKMFLNYFLFTALRDSKEVSKPTYAKPAYFAITQAYLNDYLTAKKIAK